MKEQRVAGHYLLAEFHVVYLHEVCGITLRLVDRTENQKAASLCHCLHEQYSRHYGFLREVSLEERLVDGDVLDAYDIAFSFVDDFVDKQHRIAVGEVLAYVVDVHQRSCRGIVKRGLKLLALDFLANLLGEGGVDFMTGAAGYDAAFERASDQGYVADYVEKFMTGGFVVESQRPVVDIAEIVHLLVGNADKVGDMVELRLRKFPVVDYDCIVQIPPLMRLAASRGSTSRTKTKVRLAAIS